MKRLASFTIIELLVSMLISSIIISLAYVVYHRSEVSFRKSLDQYTRNNELLQLQVLFNLDCFNVGQAKLNDDKLEIESSDQEKVYYWLTDNKIIRKTKLVIDTFKVGKIEFQTIYQFNKPPDIQRIEITAENKRSLSQPLLIQIFYTNKAKFEMTESERIMEETHGY